MPSTRPPCEIPTATSRDPADLSVTDASRMIDEGRLSPLELLDAVLGRIDALDGIIHSYLRLDATAARAAATASADRARQGRRLGPLDGIPFAVKDNILTAGLGTTAGSRVPQRHDPALNATLVGRLQASGAVLVGKLNTWEYGTGTGAVHDDLPAPPARNPWNTACYTGGSSSGSAASVAAGTALFAIGTDTGGSVRLPAAACGIVGFKPTFGRVSRHGVMPNCSSFDTPGPMTLTIADAALVYDAIAGHDPLDAASSPAAAPATHASLCLGAAGVRVGQVRNIGDGAEAPGPDIIQALDRAARALAAAGAVVVPIDLPIPPAAYRAVSAPINRSESFSANERDFVAHGALMGRSLREKLEIGRRTQPADYEDALRKRQVLVDRTDALFETVDVLLMPMTYRTAPPMTDEASVTAFTTGSAGSVFSLTGHPALALPAGFTGQGLPVSVQLAAGFFDEALLLRVAHALERQLTPVARRAPLAATPSRP